MKNFKMQEEIPVELKKFPNVKNSAIAEILTSSTNSVS